MKKIAILSLCFVLLLACAYSASADISVASTYNADHPTFGSDSQSASNPNANEDSDMDIYDTSSVSLSNNGSIAVTIASIEVVPRTTSRDKIFTVADLNVSLVDNVSIPAGGAADLTLKARIPEALDAVDNNMQEVAFHVAEIRLKNSAGVVVATFPAYMQRENHLVFDKVYVNIGDESNSVDDGDEIDGVKPGDHVVVEASVENTYDDKDEDIDIKKTKLYVIIDDRDLDVDEDPSLGTVYADDFEEDEVDFDVEEDVDDGTYDMIIQTEGMDENGAWHGEKMLIDFIVEKNKHEIKIDSLIVTPESAECGDEVSLKVEITNIGKKDEDEVTIRVMNEDFEIDTLLPNIDLEEGDTTTRTFDITIPEVVDKDGSKALTVVTYYEFNTESHREIVTIDITCEADEEEDDTTTQDTTTQTGTTPGDGDDGQNATSSSSANRVVTSGGFRGSTLYILLLVLAIVVVIAVGAVFVVKVVMANKQI